MFWSWLAFKHQDQFPKKRPSSGDICFHPVFHSDTLVRNKVVYLRTNQELPKPNQSNSMWKQTSVQTITAGTDEKEKPPALIFSWAYSLFLPISVLKRMTCLPSLCDKQRNIASFKYKRTSCLRHSPFHFSLHHILGKRGRPFCAGNSR